ncbi:transmembrane domain-containing protein [Cryptosporidium felis]|nr:transmembrane domain-containing protein [Cryptosporidium felis]
MFTWNSLFSTVYLEDIFAPKILSFRRFIIYLTTIQIIFGITNLFNKEKAVLGLIELSLLSFVGIIITLFQIPILFIIYSIISIFGCYIHHYYTSNYFMITDIPNIICISGIIINLCCSILSLKLFIEITNHINWKYSIGLSNENVHVAFIVHPRIHDSDIIEYYIPQYNNWNQEASVIHTEAGINTEKYSKYRPYKGQYCIL